jgi:hypothetical protein
MTSSSRKKRPTIQPSILRSTWLEQLGHSAGLALFFGLAAAAAPAADPAPPAVSRPAVDTYDGPASRPALPALPRPKESLASERLQRLQGRPKPSTAPSPAEEVGESSPVPADRVAAKPGSPDDRDWKMPLKTKESAADDEEDMARLFQELDRQAQSEVQPYSEPERNPARLKGLSEIRAVWSAPEPGQLPEEVRLGQAPFAPRNFPHAFKPWTASDVWYNPLYFEDPALERYGHSYHPLIQPIVSAGRMSVQFLAIPYQMTLEPMSSRVYPLGYYRPGDFAPYLIYQVPLNAEAAFNEAAVITALVFILP